MHNSRVSMIRLIKYDMNLDEKEKSNLEKFVHVKLWKSEKKDEKEERRKNKKLEKKTTKP